MLSAKPLSELWITIAQTVQTELDVKWSFVSSNSWWDPSYTKTQSHQI